MYQEYLQQADKNKSYWEADIWPNTFDVIIVGAGFTGMYCAYQLSQQSPKLKVAVLDGANLCGGASTRNAGFICFGSPSEILADLDTMDEQTVVDLIKMRFDGMNFISSFYPEKDVDMKWAGGHELFLRQEGSDFENVQSKIADLNGLVYQATGIRDVFFESPVRGIKGDVHTIGIMHEGMMHPAKALVYLRHQCVQNGVQFIPGCSVKDTLQLDNQVSLNTTLGEFDCRVVAFCVNAYADGESKEIDVKPAKNQVYVTNGFNHGLSGTFHYNEGYVYLRSLGERILIGGGRHIETEGEDVMVFNPEIENFLSQFLKTLTGNENIEWEHRWIGHIGVGEKKNPIIKQDKRVIYGVRLSGMGVALAPTLAQQLVQRIFATL